MSRPIRLTVVMTHPVQYYAPWFRYIAVHCPEIDLTVLYAIRPTPEQQGAGFGRAFAWDVPLTEGYSSRTLRPARADESVESGRFWGVNVPEITRAVRDSRPDVVLVPGWHSITLLRALWTCRRDGIPVLYRGDTHLGVRPAGWRRLLWAPRTWALLRLFGGYLSVGQRAHGYLRHFGVDASRVWDAPHCVDNGFFARAGATHQTPRGRAAARAGFGLGSDEFVVLFAGKVDPHKRPLDVIRAVARLEPGAAILVAGAGPQGAECLSEAHRLGVRVAFVGFLNQSELGRAYAAADCLVLPSASESWGLTVNEALATGLPCVVSDGVGCAGDLVSPGETGEVFPAGDVAALAAALERVRERSMFGHDWAPACRRRAADFSLERAAAGLAEACRSVTGRRAAGGHRSAPRVLACCGGMVVVAGLERMTFEVLRVVRERGGAVHCIVNSWENERIIDLTERIGASWSTGYYWFQFDRRTRNPIRWVQFAWEIVRNSVDLFRAARRFRPTHVLLPEFVSALRNLPALFALRLLGIRIICRVGNAPEPGSFYRRIWQLAIDPVTDAYVCNSAFTLRELTAHGIAESKASVVYNCAPTRTALGASRSDRDPTRIIFVGQIIPPKGLDLLLDAVGLLRAAGRDVGLDVVGDLDAWEPPGWVGYHKRIQSRAARPDTAGRVRFLGWREDVPSLLAAAAIHCCPSRPEQREAFGVVNVEAKEAGVPSVVSPSGALPELIDHRVDGWICSETTPEAIAEGLEYFLKDPARLELASEAARRSAERFSRNRFADDWWVVFQRGH